MLSNKKSVFIIFVIILCLAFPSYGMTQFLELTGGTNGGTGFDKPFFSFSLMHSMFFNKVDFISGFHYTLGQIDITARARVWLLKKEAAALGFGFLQHSGWFLSSGREYDFYGSVYGSFGSLSRFNFLFDASYTYKYSIIPSIRYSVPYISDKGIAFSIKLQKEFDSKFLVYGGVSSYEFFRYPLFLMPTYCAGFLYSHPSGLTARANIDVRYSDQFTLTAYINYVCLSAGVGCKF